MKAKKSTKLWIARDSDNKLYLYNCKPEKRSNYWTCPNNWIIEIIEIDKELFPDVKWEDEEPTLATLKI